jgi:hypothetical protein
VADVVDLTSDLSSGDFDAGNAGTVAHVPAAPGTAPAHGSDVVQQNNQPARTDTQTRQDGDKPLSLRDQLTAQFKGGEAAPAAEDRGDGRTATGQFAPKAGEPGAEAQPVTEQPGQQPAAVQAPQGIDPAVFASLPAETQADLARTMAGVEQQAERYRGYEQLETVIGARRQAWAMQGMSEAQAVNQLLALSDFAGQSPADFIGWFAGQHGIDLTALAEGGGSDEYIDPAVQELRQQVEQLTGTITNMTQGQQAAQHQSLVDFTTQFASETGTDGTLLRPHLAELGTGILPYINQVKQENPSASHKDVLTEAYERACWANPQVRQKLLAAQDAQRLAGQREHAARAAHAGSSVTGQAPAPGSTQPKDIGSGSVRDTLRAAIAAHT